MPQMEEHEKILRPAMRRPLWNHSASTRSVCMEGPRIERLIPHRAPFLLVDSITALDFEQRALEGKRRIDPDDPVFTGHFPGQPIYPGVLLLEMMGQLGLCLTALEAEKAGEGGTGDGAVLAGVRLLKIYSSFFTAPALPGDEMTLRALLIEDNGLTVTLAAQAARGETICALGLMEVYYG